MLSWVDAKIMSVKRDHHEGRCACQFSVMLNRNKVPTSFVDCTSNRVATEVITIDRIAIFQKLHCEPVEDGSHYWTYSEDCTTLKRSKLLTGTVSSEISWLIVYSVLKGMDFIIKLVQNRIVYSILNYAEWSSRASDMQLDSDSEGISPISEEYIKVLSFRKSNETLKPKIETLFHVVVQELTGPDTTVEEDIGYQPVNYESDVEILYDYVNLRRSKRRKVHPERFTSYSEPNFNRGSTKKNDSNELDQSTSMIASLLMDEQPLQIQHSGEMNIDELIEWLPAMQQARFASQEVMHEILGKTPGELQAHNPSDENAIRTLPGPPTVVEIEDTSDSDSFLDEESSSEDEETSETSDSDVPQSKFQFVLKHEGSRTRTKKGSPSSHRVYQSSWPKLRKYSSEKKLYSSKKKLLTASECKQLMEKFMVNTESEMGGQPQPDGEQTASAAKFWEEFTDFTWSPVTETEMETDENEDLWKEMDDSLTTLALHEQKQVLGSSFWCTNSIFFFLFSLH